MRKKALSSYAKNCKSEVMMVVEFFDLTKFPHKYLLNRLKSKLTRMPSIFSISPAEIV